MEDVPEKKELNLVAISITLLLAVAIIGAIVWKSVDSSPDYAVTKKKIDAAGMVNFRKAVEQMVDSYTVGHAEGLPIVHPPAGSDIYLLARSYDWGEYMLELEQGKSYHLHLASLDVRHTLIVNELNLIHQIDPGELITVQFSPAKAGRFEIKCGYYCGPKHHNMIGVITILTAHDSVLNNLDTSQ